MPPFNASPNVLFETRVGAVRRLSPGFVRLTLTGPRLDLFGPYGLDQRIKVLVPSGAFPDVFGGDTGAGGGGTDGDLLSEAEWRARWRALPVAERPFMRSYTVGAVRPADREVDVDFYLHSAPGPASAFAASARGGERLLLSGPDVRRGRPAHGIQWAPGPATRVLLTGDEAAFPAIRNILPSLGPSVRAEVIVEAEDPADAAWLAEGRAGCEPTVVPRPVGGAATAEASAEDGADSAAGALGAADCRARRPRGPLQEAIDAWARSHGAGAAALGSGFYAWTAAESTCVAWIRDRLRGAGIAPDRVQAQGYWNAKGRKGERRVVAGAAGTESAESGAVGRPRGRATRKGVDKVR